MFAQVWRQKAQYLQHKQNKAEATTVKHKTKTDNKTKGIYKPVWNIYHGLSLPVDCCQLCFSITAACTGTGILPLNKASSTVSLSPARAPEVDPIDAAAHLQLLGESLSLIGHRLQETEVYFHIKAVVLSD